MARFSATLCCKYVRYKRADETTTNTRQMMAIPTYLNILLITIHSLGEPSLPWDRIFVPSVPPPSKHSIHLLLRVCVNLRPSVVVQNRVDFSSPQLWTKLIQKSLPSGSHLKKLNIGDCSWCSADVLDGDYEKSRISLAGAASESCWRKPSPPTSDDSP